MPSPPTISELRKAGEIGDDEIDAAVDVVMESPETSAYPVGGGHLLNLALAVQTHDPTARALADSDRSEKFKRKMARTAILLARPDRR
ncbi:hypothetical protein [Methylobacterium trifolii]|uniref:Uncharacterized protein n=1 Tax=Methylobacterium trifolii TaxID=1003092 RepID=A0ABQ4U7J1_9HYPH|nr:hypothetical protein [Methylobacterium trifolii]GJE62766.1 hypothetical protein MPOCJGCO_4902 [Methylobacterium trifolii]